jgi:hypothetical protein
MKIIKMVDIFVSIKEYCYCVLLTNYANIYVLGNNILQAKEH